MQLSKKQNICIYGVSFINAPTFFFFFFLANAHTFQCRWSDFNLSPPCATRRETDSLAKNPPTKYRSPSILVHFFKSLIHPPYAKFRYPREDTSLHCRSIRSRVFGSDSERARGREGAKVRRITFAFALSSIAYPQAPISPWHSL